MLVLLDTTILTNFARVGLAQMIRDLWGEQICTTVAALREYQAGISTAGLPPLAWRQLRVLELAPEEEILASDRFQRLGLGERTCLAVAIVRSSILATDDKLARRAGKQFGIQVIGTIGILRTCIKQSLLSQSKAQIFLDEMIAAGYYSPTRNLKDE